MLPSYEVPQSQNPSGANADANQHLSCLLFSSEITFELSRCFAIFRMNSCTIQITLLKQFFKKDTFKLKKKSLLSRCATVMLKN